MSVSVWFEGRWPDLNTYIDAERSNRYQAAEMKRTYTQAAQHIAQASGVSPVETPCVLSFVWHLADRRRDPDNVAFATKFILDGLVAAGVLRNDGHKHIGALQHDYVIDRDGREGVSVTLITLRDLPRLRQERNNTVCRAVAARVRGDLTEFQRARRQQMVLEFQVTALEKLR